MNNSIAFVCLSHCTAARAAGHNIPCWGHSQRELTFSFLLVRDFMAGQGWVQQCRRLFK